MGNYEILEGGNQAEAIATMAAAPSDYFSTVNGATLGPTAWTAMNTAFPLQYVMSLSTAGVSDATPSSLGIPNNHAYTVVGTYVLHDTGGTPIANVIKLRNPWGKDATVSFTGIYCDSCTTPWSAVSAADKITVGYINDATDGFFFLLDTEFISPTFSDYTISYYRDLWVHSVSEVIGDDGIYKKFTFTFAAPTNAYIGVHYYPPRMYAPTCRPSGYTTALLAIYGPNQQLTEVWGNSPAYDWEQFSSVYSTAWAAGTYNVFVKTTWLATDVAKDFTFRVYAPSAVTITQPAPQPSTANAAME